MNNKVIKNYIYNVIYQVFVIIVPLITTPYISRVLGSEGIGIFSYTQSISYFFYMLGSLGCNIYGQREVAYVQDDPDKRTLVFKDMITIRMISTMVACTIYLGAFGFGNNQYNSYFLIMGMEVLSSAFDISWFFMGLQDFKKTVLRNVVIKLLGVISIFTFVHSSLDVGIYALCYVIPVLFSNIALWFYLPQYLTKIKREKWIDLKHIAPMVLLFIPQVATEVYTVLDKAMLGLLASHVSEVGFYEQAQKIIKIVVRIVTALGIVMLPKISKDFAEGKMEQILNSIKKSFQFVFLLGSPLMFGMIGIAETFVPWFYGPGYDKVIILMQVISPIIILISISNVIGKEYLLPVKMQKEYTISIISGSCINVVFNLVLIHYFDAIGASIATVLAEGAVSVVQIIMVKNKIPVLKYISSGGRYLLYGFIMCLIVIFTGKVVAATVIGTLIQVGVGSIVYVGFLVIFKDDMFNEGISLLLHKKGK